MAVLPYAEVIVEITAKKLDRIFHYSIPPALRECLRIGSRVIVPFGNRTLGGYVSGFSETPGVSGVKDIIDVTDEDSLLSEDLLTLAGWISEKYMCSKVEAVRAMLPARTRTAAGHKYIFPLENNDLFHEEKVKLLNAAEKNIYELVLKSGAVSSRELREKLGNTKAGKVLKKLTESGLVRVSEGVMPEAGPRVIQTVSVAPDLDLVKVIDSLKRAPKQAAVLKAAAEKGPLSIGELVEMSATNSGVVRELIKKGFLTRQSFETRRDPYGSKSFEQTKPLELTRPQADVLENINTALNNRKHQVFLLYGVTGSGKTEVYLQAIDKCLKQGRQAIVLVPEISLTPQMVERFKGRFGELVAVLHSRLSAGERFDEWKLIKAGKVKVVVGARSAVFAPFDDPGLIIIDEEHESSYKQEDNPKYHAREAAIARARLGNGVVILGSATPSVESYTRAAAGKYSLLRLPDRVANRPMPEVTVVDLRDELNSGNRSIFSRLLVKKIQAVLERKEQVILFLNRRGYSTFVICRECGLVMNCPKCSITLTFHSGENLLRCHYCDFRRKAPDICPKCGSKSIRHFGIGTQKVEEEVLKRFPDAKTARMDMDTTSTKGSHERILEDFKKRRVDILIGTQMIAKGLDFPGVTLVGVITADTALNLPDFRSAEKTFQLLTQVAGRAGRGELPGEVVVQTYNPEHYSIINARQHDYRSFFAEEIKVREAMEYPPYSSLIRILIYGMEENSVIRGAEVLAHELNRLVNIHDMGLEQPILGPAPAALNKLRNRYRWQICIKGKQGQQVRQIAKTAIENIEVSPWFSNLGVSIDVDPLSIL